jgi:peptidyl-prolyl cis-trans isomerase D
MLQDFRKIFKGQQALTGGMMLALAVGMLAYLAPTGAGGETPDSVVARVYGKDILKRDYDWLLVTMVRGIPKGQDVESQMPMLRKYALQELMRRKIEEAQAERHGVVVTDGEVRERLEGMLKSQPVFLEADGRLKSVADIEMILRDNGLSLRQWELESRAYLQNKKLTEMVSAGTPVDEAWLNRELRARHETVSFESVLVQPDTGAVADPGDGKLGEFLKASGERFRQPARRVVQFVALDQTAMQDQLNVDEAAVKAAFEAKKAEYQQLKASHILFTAKSEAEMGEALKRAEALRAKLAAGLDFAKAANENTQDPSGVGKGGDLGWFSHGQMVQPFQEAANALKEGELSQPVKTPFGVHLIKLTGRREKPFEEAKPELMAQISRERFATRAKAKLEELRKKGEFAAAARGLNLPLGTSKPFLNEPSATIEGIPMAGPVVQAAFAAKVGEVSPVLETGGQLVVFRVKEELAAAVPPLAEIRAKVLDGWRTEEARRALSEKAKAALASGDLKALGAPVADAKSPEAYDLGKHPAVRAALLDTADGKTTAPVWTDRGLWAARILSRSAVGEVDFGKRKAVVEALQREAGDRLLQAEQQQMLAQGRLRPGFSSLWGRLDGIWVSEIPDQTVVE